MINSALPGTYTIWYDYNVDYQGRTYTDPKALSPKPRITVKQAATGKQEFATHWHLESIPNRSTSIRSNA